MILAIEAIKVAVIGLLAFGGLLRVGSQTQEQGVVFFHGTEDPKVTIACNYDGAKRV